MSPGLRGARTDIDRRARYQASLVRNSHRWLAAGYEVLDQELDAASFEGAEEEVITGELVRYMNGLVEQPDTPPWLSHLAVCEEIPQNAGRRLGKRRKRIDIEIIRVTAGPRLRFCIEAKRLYRSNSVSEYLGDRGLGCFLAGEYAAAQPRAGMLAYVQHDEPADWARKIAAALNTRDAAYRVRTDGQWRATKIVAGLSDTFETSHDREAPEAPISISHVFLRFHG